MEQISSSQYTYHASVRKRNFSFMCSLPFPTQDMVCELEFKGYKDVMFSAALFVSAGAFAGVATAVVMTTGSSGIRHFTITILLNAETKSAAELLS